MIYGYCRVSSRDQNLERQLQAMHNVGIDSKHIFIDKESGKDFDRVGYQTLKHHIGSGDCLFIQSLDRFGRNYTEILDEWKYLTSRQIDIVVLDMDILDTRTTGKNGLVGRFVSDLVLQVLAFVAEQERLNIRERQRQGINIARLQGKKFGRPTVELPDDFPEIARRYRNGSITGTEAADKLSMPRSTFYYKVKTNSIYEEMKGGSKNG